jgi:hypothetical protein
MDPDAVEKLNPGPHSRKGCVRGEKHCFLDIFTQFSTKGPSGLYADPWRLSKRQHFN